MSYNRKKVLVSVGRHVQRGAFDKALSELDGLAKKDPQDAEVWVEMGDVRLYAGDAQGAVRAYAQAAAVFAAHGDNDSAVGVYRTKVLEVHPGSVNARLRLAELYRHAGMLSDALDEYRTIARIYEQRARDDDAQGVLEHILSLDPNDVPTRVRLAELHTRNDRVDAAIAELTVAAEHLRRDGRTEEYIRVAERMLYHQRDNLAVLRDVVQLHLDSGKPRTALARLQRWLKETPDDIAALELLARTFDSLQQPAKAAAVFKEVARLHHVAGRESHRDTVWRHVLDRVPDDPEAIAALTPVGSEEEVETVEDSAAGRPDGERLLLATAGESQPDAEPAVDAAERTRLLAETDVYLKYGLSEKARDHLELLLLREPRYVPALRRLRGLVEDTGDASELADVLVRLAEAELEGNRDAGLAYLVAAIGANPHHQGARTMLQALGVSPDVEVVEEHLLATSDIVEVFDAFSDPDGLDNEGETRAVTQEITDDLLLAEETLGEALVREACEDADFFVQQGLLEDAQNLLEEALGKVPGEPQLIERIGRVAELVEGTEMQVEQEAVDRALLQTIHPVTASAVPENRRAMDGQAHFDLGIAYREMGLVSEAIDEFRKAMESGVRRSECHRMLGLCNREVSRFADAVDWLKRGLRVKGNGEAEAAAMHFELAEVYAAMDDSSEAAAHYRQADSLDANYPELGDRLRRLGIDPKAPKERPA